MKQAALLPCNVSSSNVQSLFLGWHCPTDPTSVLSRKFEPRGTVSAAGCPVGGLSTW